MRIPPHLSLPSFDVPVLINLSTANQQVAVQADDHENEE